MMAELNPELVSLLTLIARIGIVMTVIVVTYYAYWRFHPSKLDR